jgi:hypothetical protein
MCDSFKFITVRWFNLILFIYLFIWQTCRIQLFSKRLRHLHNFSKQTHSPIELSSQASGSLYICQNTEVTAAPIVDTTTEMIWKPIDAFTWNEELKDEILDVPAVYVAKKIELFCVYDANTWNNATRVLDFAGAVVRANTFHLLCMGWILTTDSAQSRGISPGALVYTPDALVYTPGALVYIPGALVYTPGALVCTPGALLCTHKESWQSGSGKTVKNKQLWWLFCVGVVYSGEYDVCDVTLSVHPHRASWKVSLTTVGIEPATFQFYFLNKKVWNKVNAILDCKAYLIISKELKNNSILA